MQGEAIVSRLAINLSAPRNKMVWLRLDTQRFRTALKGVLTGHRAANGQNLLIDTSLVARMKHVTFHDVKVFS